MSTFDGVVKEYPLVSIDRFEEINYASTTYFLSHCHKDHMHGLDSGDFYDLLKTRGFSKIYLSDVSSHLLKKDERYWHLSNYLVELPIDVPRIITLSNQQGTAISTVTVTLLTAGHCPGSVMFFIEGDNGNVLYTGDFRLPVGSSKRLEHLHENGNSLKPLKSLYIDTTFCSRSCLYIPSREECLKAIVSKVGPCLSKGPNNIVYLLCRYELAYEFVFVELYKRFGVKTHVTKEWEEKYSGIKGIEDAVTSYASEARIHACILDTRNNNAESAIKNYYRHDTPCGFVSPNGKPVYVLKIKPTAMFFTNKASTKVSEFIGKTQTHRVFYSTHPSLSEIRDMVSYLKPKQVFPNVVWDQTTEEILDLIFGTDQQAALECSSEDSSIPPLGKLKSPSVKDTTSLEGESLPFLDDYKIETKYSTHHQATSSVSRFKETLHLETDYENTNELEAMLREEIYSQKVVSASNNHHDQSFLRWENPIVSSDEEIFESSSDSLSRNKSDSDINGTPEDIKINCPNGEDEKLPAHLSASESNSSVNNSASESLIKEQHVKNSTPNKNDNHNVIFSLKEMSQVDEEYLKISEVDNGLKSYVVEAEENNAKCLSNSNSDVSENISCSKNNLQVIPDTSKILPECNSKENSFICKINMSQPNTNYYKMLKTDDIQNKRKLSGVTVKEENGSPLHHFQIVDIGNNAQYSKECHLKHLNSLTNKCLKNGQRTPVTHNNDVVNDTSTHKHLDLKENISKADVYCNKKKRKSFQFVKKINSSSSESEDEFTFRHVVKLPEKSRTDDYTKSILLNVKEKKSITHAFLNSQKQKEQSCNTSPGVKKHFKVSDVKNPVTENGLNEKSLIHDTFKKFETKSKSVINETNKFENQDHLKSESTKRLMNKLCNSLESDTYTHGNIQSVNPLLKSNICFNEKQNIAESLSHSGQNITNTTKKNDNPLKTTKNSSVDANKVSDAELIDLVSDPSSIEDDIPVINAKLTTEFNKSSNLNLPSTSYVEHQHTSQVSKSSVLPSTSCTKYNQAVNHSYASNSSYTDYQQKSRTVQQNMPNKASVNSNLLHISDKHEPVSNPANSYEAQIFNIKSTCKRISKNINALLPDTTGEESVVSNDSPEIIQENYVNKESSNGIISPSQNKISEKINSSWEIKSASQSSSVIVEEVISSSDCDDSPSLIAPIVPKSLYSCNNSSSSSFTFSKRRKITPEKGCSFNKAENCDKNINSVCDSYLVDSDSTPELLENNNLLTNNEISDKRLISADDW